MTCAKNRHDSEKNHDKKLQITLNLQKSVTIRRKNVTANCKSQKRGTSLQTMRCPVEVIICNRKYQPRSSNTF